MARRRFEQLSRERQDEILRVAAAEFARSGFHGTSYNQLLERLQLGKSSAYYYFDDKRDLFITALQRCYETYFLTIRALERPTCAYGFWDFVHHVSHLGYEHMLADPTAASLMQCLQRERALFGELVSTELLGMVDGFHAEMIREGQRLGAIRTDLPETLLVDAVREIGMSCDRWFIGDRDQGNAVMPDEAAWLFTDLARRICSPV